jgi:hypothetical protein
MTAKVVLTDVVPPQNVVTRLRMTSATSTSHLGVQFTTTISRNPTINAARAEPPCCASYMAPCSTPEKCGEEGKLLTSHETDMMLINRCHYPPSNAWLLCYALS